jgi:hypothetical protein
VLATIAATIIAYLIKLGILSTEGEWLEVHASGTLHEDHPLYANVACLFTQERGPPRVGAADSLCHAAAT